MGCVYFKRAGINDNEDIMENYKTSICVVGRRIQTCEAVAESAAH